jgi:hypothetical protein
MYNRKAGVAIEEIVGLLVYAVAFVIICLLFYSCNVNSSKETNENLKVSKYEIGVITELNTLLNSPGTGSKKSVDLAVESYLNNDYKEFDDKTREFFSESDFCWKLEVLDADDLNLHSLYNCENYGEIIAQNSVTVPLVDKNSEVITILFQIREKPKNAE